MEPARRKNLAPRSAPGGRLREGGGKQRRQPPCFFVSQEGRKEGASPPPPIFCFATLRSRGKKGTKFSPGEFIPTKKSLALFQMTCSLILRCRTKEVRRGERGGKRCILAHLGGGGGVVFFFVWGFCKKAAVEEKEGEGQGTNPAALVFHLSSRCADPKRGRKDRPNAGLPHTVREKPSVDALLSG